jgi:hypothetical protein
MARANSTLLPNDDGLTPLERRRRAQAARLNCFTEGEVAELSGYALGTLETYRHRRVGFPWIRVGPEVLYPAEPLREQLQKDVQFPRGLVANAL